ncbi:MAG: hypothetical protein ABR987_25015 [Terracidiphilus sp.]|jgi:uncharacterized membrane protein
MYKLSLAVGALLAVLTVPGMAATATFQILATPFVGSASLAVSGDGSVVAINNYAEIYRWTAANGFQDLGPADPNNGSLAISRDGTAIATGIIGADGFGTPGRWTAAGWEDLGHPANGCTPIGNAWGSGWGINGNGNIVVGLAWTCTDAEGFIWTSKTGALSLGFPVGNSSRASAISANGKTIVGFWEGDSGRRPVRWVSFGRPDLFLGANAMGEAYAVTSDGSTLVGQNVPPKAPEAIAFVYSDAAGVTYLGTLSGKSSDQSFANGISDQGIVVGWSGNFRSGYEGFIWTPETGLLPLQTALNNLGANIPSTVTLITPLAISADGSTIVGTGTDNRQSINWIATLSR